MKIPVVYDAHDGVYELISSLEINSIVKKIYLLIGLFFERVTLRRCAGIITVSEAKKEFENHLRGEKEISFTIWRWINLVLWRKMFIKK